jgi:tRNA uridine 5-carboxymethylaminomethyl modification enzyme
MKSQPTIVIAGCGHAGIEAAWAAANIGVKVIIVTMDTNAVARLSCNPAIGGLGKGHLVKEIDALGGIMGRAADICGIQFKTLNKSKGRAVWSLRAQIDKHQYPHFVSECLIGHKNIQSVEGEVVDFSVDNLRITTAVLRDGSRINTNAIVVCTGTFLNGIIHIGNAQYPAGRIGERPSVGLTHSIVNHGFTMSRLKTGTPPRLLSESVDWDLAALAHGDVNPRPFSVLTKRPFAPENIPCYIVDTNKAVHELLEDNLSKSAMYSGKISGAGPRYCPSIEDKIVRFKSRQSHQLFLEPEWRGSNQIYVNGFSTSMPANVQLNALRQIPALRNVEFIRPGYAIEYDYFPTSQLKSTLETKRIDGLYFAGQLNGTSGYEEAASQGLIAGANAAIKTMGGDPFVLGRHEAYIGVLIDDLITKDIHEPYRMFTSSAEHRLSLRSDNAGSRLTAKGYNAGIVSNKQLKIQEQFDNEVSELKLGCKKLKTQINGTSLSLYELIKRPEWGIINDVEGRKLSGKYSSDAIFTAETDIKYEGYVNIENARVGKLKKLDGIKIPPTFDYYKLTSLSSESRERLSIIKPETLGQASRLAGVRPADIGVLAVYLQSSS